MRCTEHTTFATVYTGGASDESVLMEWMYERREVEWLKQYSEGHRFASAIRIHWSVMKNPLGWEILGPCQNRKLNQKIGCVGLSGYVGDTFHGIRFVKNIQCSFVLMMVVVALVGVFFPAFETLWLKTKWIIYPILNGFWSLWQSQMHKMRFFVYKWVASPLPSVQCSYSEW